MQTVPTWCLSESTNRGVAIVPPRRKTEVWLLIFSGFVESKTIICQCQLLVLQCVSYWITQAAMAFGHVFSNCVVVTCAWIRCGGGENKQKHPATWAQRNGCTYNISFTSSALKNNFKSSIFLGEHLVYGEENEREGKKKHEVKFTFKSVISDQHTVWAFENVPLAGGLKPSVLLCCWESLSQTCETGPQTFLLLHVFLILFIYYPQDHF